MTVMITPPMLTSAQTPITATPITALNAITDPDGHYVITADITGGAPVVSTFNGILEANIDNTTKMPYRIKNLSAPLFTTLTGTVKNLVLENVGISGHTGNTGAIACTANGNARIYNVGILSGEVGGTGYTGGLVGLLDGTNATDVPRVVNCYSFANITSGSTKAGIVGYNNYASKYNNLRTMVMNCMFYGDIAVAAGTEVVPIYGGDSISNRKDDSVDSRLNNYNYFLYEAPFSVNRNITKYNCALAAEKRFLVRFEFYRHLLNSNRELASGYVFGSIPNDSQEKIFKWVLDLGIAPYPILKTQGKYPSVVNYDPEKTFNHTTNRMENRADITKRNCGGKLKNGAATKTLTVTISATKTDGGQTWPTGAATSINTTPFTIDCIDKDTANFNFNYDKVQLPYYNDYGDKNYTGNRVVTGWKIVSVTKGTRGTFSTGEDYGDYNFADRRTYAKDLYSVSKRVFSQGAYFDVPDGVTGITIEPYWAIAAYLSDGDYDRYGYNGSNVSGGVNLFGTRYSNNTNYTICGSSQKVYTGVNNNLLGNFSSASSTVTVYDQAIVLVGNYHNGGDGEINGGDKPFTVMSIDLNHDNEPDYSLIYRSGKQKDICHIRFDFINVPAMSMAHKTASSNNMAIPGNCKPKGWYETTNTALIRYNQFEYDHNNKVNGYPLILLGGVIEQFVSTNYANDNEDPNHTIYIHLGSNVWFKLFSNGVHMDKKAQRTPHRPISVTGGEYQKFYLSGYFSPTTPYYSDNAECYIDGGLFGEVAGSGQEKIDGNVTWLVNHADIESFYGGGINSQLPISGNVIDTILNSCINYYCGGPKFGDIQTGKKVETYAEGCTFGTYFGAGYGGTALYRDIWSPGLDKGHNRYGLVNYAWNDWLTDDHGYKRGVYEAGKGIMVDYQDENFEGSNDKTVGRLYTLHASLSLASTKNVKSVLKNCTVTNNFYGGGSLGFVDGNVVSELDGCTVNGNVFGGGFSVDIPIVKVYPAASKSGTTYINCFDPVMLYNTKTGVFQKSSRPDPVEYKWSSIGGTGTDNTLTDDGDNHWIYTDENLNNLGSVGGNTTTTLKGNTRVEGNVFGGGDESSVEGSTTVILEEGATVSGNVYGGGNEGPVGGDSEVIIQNQPSSK